LESFLVEHACAELPDQRAKTARDLPNSADWQESASTNENAQHRQIATVQPFCRPDTTGRARPPKKPAGIPRCFFNEYNVSSIKDRMKNHQYKTS
jgi:hypothetical protein